MQVYFCLVTKLQNDFNNTHLVVYFSY